MSEYCKVKYLTKEVLQFLVILLCNDIAQNLHRGLNNKKRDLAIKT